MPEERPVISSSRLTAPDVLRHTFATIRKGLDPKEVSSYLELVARELQAWEEREVQLRHELTEAEQRAKNPVIDESTLSAALGQQSAQVLRSAHEEAARIVAAAEESAATLLRETQQQASDIQIRAEQSAAERIAEAELSVGSVRAQVQQEASSMLDAARLEGEVLLAQARDEGLVMVDQAQHARKRVLTDLAQRRRALYLQIEQLRAARDELKAAVLGVRDTVDQVVSDLAGADDKARAAAAEVAARGPLEPLTDEAELGTADLGPEIEGLDEVSVIDGESPVPGAISTEVPTTDPGMVVDQPAAAPSGSVDELFARIRASHEEPAQRATPGPVAAGERTVSDDELAAKGVRVVSVSEEVADTGAAAQAERVQLEERAALLDPVTTNLARRVKRALQDDQNRLLDGIRSASGKWRGEMVPSEDDQRALFFDAANGLLSDAFEAGAAFTHKQGYGTPGPVTESAAKVADGLASDLAATVVTLLRRPFSGDEGAFLGTDEDEAVERVSAAYREWRGERIERLVGDFALGAFSAGALESISPGTGIRWLHTGKGAACPDCEDNSLAGVVTPGEEFPTGHRHPPAHAGCRCMVAPTPM